MTELIKAGGLSNRYGVSTRTLRYYEEIGLIQSQRTDEYAYRMYDAANIKKLEQILILRKLNIGIKDIQRIFNAVGSDVVLEVLTKKVGDIDEEVALLHELKEIVIAFIRQIEQADFSKDSDVKLLYDKAKEIEIRLANAEYAGNPSPAHRLFEVADRLEEKAVSRLQIPDNVLKRLLQNVYFIWGDGIDVADELGRKYGMFVYHTCNYRHIHGQNSDPRYQPELCREVADFFSLDPEDALRRELAVRYDFTPMVIMDLIRLTAIHDKVICENDIDIDSVIHLITNSVTITNRKNDAEAYDGFLDRYEIAIRSRDISEDEKEGLVRKLRTVWKRDESERPRETTQYGIRQIIRDENWTVGQTAEIVADFFGLPSV
jgi:DNA-binding transcriptional MerR regulator